MIWSLIFALVSASHATELVAKVRSNLCGAPRASELNGSGWAFTYKNEIYLLTSEHVVYHDPGVDANVCHEVRFQNESAWRRADLKIVDRGVGLGLLRVRPTSAAPDVRALERTRAFNPAQANQVVVTTLGVPAAATSVYADGQGRIITTQSERHLIPLLERTYELLGVHGEFGMSGGPVFTDESGSVLVGVLSNQYIEQRPGQPAAVRELDRARTENVNHIFVIPGDFALNWLKSALSDKPFRASLLSPLASDRPFDRALTSGLEFEARPTTLKAWPRINARAMDSGDGAGIGGASDDVSAIEIHIDFASTSFPTEWFLPARRDWLERVRDQLHERARIRIPFLIERDQSTQRLSRVPITSLADFFAKLRNPQIQPAMAISGSYGDFDRRSELLRAEASRLDAGTTALAKNAITPATRVFLSRIDDLRVILQEDAWLTLSEADVASLARVDGEFAIAWRELFKDQPESSIALLSALNRAQCLVRYGCRIDVKGR